MNTQNRTTIPVSFRDTPVEPVQLLQIWLLPSPKGVDAGDARRLRAEATSNTLTLTCAPEGCEKSIKIHQDVQLFIGERPPGETVRRPTEPPRHTRIQLIEGDLDINGQKFSSGDTASVDDEKELRLASEKGAHFLLFDLC